MTMIHFTDSYICWLISGLGYAVCITLLDLTRVCILLETQSHNQTCTNFLQFHIPSYRVTTFLTKAFSESGKVVYPLFLHHIKVKTSQIRHKISPTIHTMTGALLGM